MNIKKKLSYYCILSSIFCIILGTLLHFTYEWFNLNKFVGFFSATNESTWEHLKLIFFPMVFSTLIAYYVFGHNISNFICSRSIGIFSAICFIIIFFYTYTGVIGQNFALINILSFIIAVIIGEYISYTLITSNFRCKSSFHLFLLLLLLICFIVFSYYPPRINLFKDPITGSFSTFFSQFTKFFILCIILQT